MPTIRAHARGDRMAIVHEKAARIVLSEVKGGEYPFLNVVGRRRKQPLVEGVGFEPT